MRTLAIRILGRLDEVAQPPLLELLDPPDSVPTTGLSGSSVSEIGFTSISQVVSGTPECTAVAVHESLSASDMVTVTASDGVNPSAVGSVVKVLYDEK